MAGAQVSVVATQVGSQRLGHMALSLSNFASNTLEPQIAAGSKLEAGGALYEFTALESITGWAGIANSNQAYIKTTVGGGGATITASWTVTAPTWDTAKQGWYIGSDRVIGGCYKDSGGNYSLKWLYDEHDQVASIKRYGDGTALLPNGCVLNGTLGAAAVSAAKIAFTLSAGSQVVNYPGSWVVPAGVYAVVIGGAQASGARLVVDGNVSASVFAGGTVISDGANVAIGNYYGSAGSLTVYYRKLA